MDLGAKELYQFLAIIARVLSAKRKQLARNNTVV
jgi:hypothetical protein